MREFSIIFWDFDGVIKESVEVKTQAYFQLFEPFGLVVAERVREHHEAHGGMSRFDKLPLYLQWAGVDASSTNVDEYCEKFKYRVVQGVIDAPWVSGVERYLRSNSDRQTFVLVSATPQEELEYIIGSLGLESLFFKVYGAPTRKHDAIRTALISLGVEAQFCLMVGDAQEDLNAAVANRMPFLLRRHAGNVKAFAAYTGLSIKDFSII